ncbi:histidinol-phosphate transaminase [Thiomicrospira sp. WB1]|uniref:histidinol-phosphate transaminase n=1 Tax=Thiomicrospira sp. WB1 TaxID=1685380 RepID=UPI0007497732|nr:histidinol-phosphate transaminase [Thiomicrospira sp. WB1]KUJ72044.1 aspartate aminotransferase [Thiomicrospira sp. WB1]
MTEYSPSNASCPVAAKANAAVKGIHPYQPGKPIDELQREYHLTRISKLASNENPLGSSHKATQAIQNALKDMGRYPDGHGFYLKRGLSEHLDQPEECIATGNGSNELLELVARVFAGPGDEVIYSQHAFAVYAISTQAVGADAVEVPARNWGHDLNAMAAAVTDQTRLIYLANPNNPTGTRFGKREWETFMSKIPPEVVVVLDEAYFEYAQSRDDAFNGLHYLGRYPNLIVTRTFSKAYGLAALRVGYAVAHPEIIHLINRLREPFNVNHMAQVAATAALKDPVFVQKTIETNHQGMQQLESFLKEHQLSFIPSSANFICVDFGEKAQAMNEALLKEGVIVRPLAQTGELAPFLRVSIGTFSENRHFMQALMKILRNPA